MKKEVDLKKFVKQLWFLLKPSRRKIYWLVFWAILVEILHLIGPYILKIIIDLILEFKAEDIQIISLWIVGMFVANQIASFFGYVKDRKSLEIVADTDYYLANDAQNKMVCLDLAYHEKENTGNKIVKIDRGIDRIRELLLSLFWEIIPTFFQIIFTTIVLFWVSVWFGVTILFFVPIFVWITLKVNKKVHPQRIKIYKKGEEASGLMTQSIININTVKSFVQEKLEVEKFRKINFTIKDNVLKVFGSTMNYNLLRTLVINLGRTTILFFGIYLIWKGLVTIGSLVFVISISEKALISLFRISRLYDNIMESSEPVARLYELNLEEARIKNPVNGIKPKNLQGEIEFKNVSYAYSDNSRKALRDVSFKIKPHQMTALVGPSGGGKTTSARMIFRHYDPQKGAVLLDGHDLRKYDLPSFRKQIAIVPQDVEVFNNSIKENIAYARPEASFAEIKKAAKIANAEEFINNLEKGYDTEVGERGIKLSGGQRQRIGIARAILADPKILIFDEATSNLDSYSEKLIQEAMEKIRKNRTVIVIAHRLSTIKKSDQIFVLEDGQLVEKGTHTQLAQEKCGLYRKLIDLQKLHQVE
jgi:ABC-type multidrug transport system fused ATPase/permease subunit